MIDMTSHAPTGGLGRGESADIWRKMEKRRLKRFAVDLKRRLSRRAAATKRKAAGTSPMVGEATAAIPPLVPTTSEVASVDLQTGIVAPEDVAVGQQPSAGEADSNRRPLCSMVCGVVIPNPGDDFFYLPMDFRKP